MNQSDLDFALLKLNKTDITHPLSIYDIFGSGTTSHLSDFQKIICLEKLRDEGLCKRKYPTKINKEIMKREKVKNLPSYYITYDGWLLIDKVKKDCLIPYTRELRRRQNKKLWNIVFKVFPIVISTLAIIFTAHQLILSQRSFEEMKTSKTLEKKLENEKILLEHALFEIDSLRNVSLTSKVKESMEKE